MTTEDKTDLEDSLIPRENASNPDTKQNQKPMNYKEAGVDVEAGYE